MLMKAFDRNGDGQVSFDELLRFCAVAADELVACWDSGSEVLGLAELPALSAARKGRKTRRSAGSTLASIRRASRSWRMARIRRAAAALCTC